MEFLSSDKIAVIDLSSGKVEEDELSEELIEERIGGVGVTTYLYEEYKDEDPVVLGTGMLTGTMVPGSSLGIITAKSPLTGKICHAPFSMYAGVEMKYAGFDYLVIKGTSDTPVYLWLHDGIADIKEAGSLWGQSPWEIVDIKNGLRSELGDELIQFLNIGKAGEEGLDNAQILVNCWSSGDRFGFGKIFGNKKLKSIALRGMGLFEIAEPEEFVNISLDILSDIKRGPAINHRGCIEFPAASGEEDIKDWIAPIVHRHTASFNCPYPSNTFVKFDEDPQILKETDLEEPGVMITDIWGVTGFKRMGLSAEDSCRMLAECNRYGIEPVAAADLLSKTGKTGIEDLKKELSGVKGCLVGAGISIFSPCTPPKPLFADFGLSGDENETAKWLERRQATAYIFGIDPVIAVMSPELTEEKLLNLLNIGTELEISSDVLANVINSVCEY